MIKGAVRMKECINKLFVAQISNYKLSTTCGKRFYVGHKSSGHVVDSHDMKANAILTEISDMAANKTGDASD